MTEPALFHVDLTASVPCVVDGCILEPSWRCRTVCEPRHGWAALCAHHRRTIAADYAAAVLPHRCVACAGRLEPPYIEWAPL